MMITLTKPDDILSNIHDNGYYIIKNFISSTLANDLLNELPINNVYEFPHSKFIYNLQKYNPKFFTVFTQSTLLNAILKSALNDQWYSQIPLYSPNYILRGLVGRSSGREALKMHIDSFIPYVSPLIINLICMISLENASVNNGSTEVVPGSHLSGKWASQSSDSEAIQLECSAGDLVLLDGRTWHRSGSNNSPFTRWTLTATFSRWWIKQSYDISQSIPENILNQLTLDEKSILGFCNRPPLDENDRINIQGGHDLLINLNN
jgi:ectoine hydroxylase-related dioxygenase (phytanoyl-CoA dioxygenase family)